MTLKHKTEILKFIVLGFFGSFLFYKRQNIIGSILEYAKQNHKNYSKQFKPQRIILIRHGESEGNVDDTKYAYKADNKIELTEKGKKQAYQIGKQLKQLIGNNYVLFYYSPFVRTIQTLNEIKKSFDPSNYREKEDCRLRELEWGNLQTWNLDAKQRQQIIDERNTVGKFYYRFQSGESGCDVYNRICSFLGSFKRQIKKDLTHKRKKNDVVIVAHGLTIRLFIMYGPTSNKVCKSLANQQTLKIVNA
ncbi:hypothetical protein PPERSA_05072 [Pseudocohnilembus persalinus]|uniref:Histidine phosphatase superfamily, clade-1 n=1 Tax=Pseudocohnilembus persalinus TaxID=266149 RepID=A0A0V0QW52_PSEPJ|nr:hypothetical protein PPERSA_05072 [Pseudocohnilembus persalinus]|eukprot:KRX06459.1 hypothetical protein PPERSA_05072 [Pseudocohnilembus persalinus]